MSAGLMEDEELLTVEQAATMLNVSPMTVYRRIKQGDSRASGLILPRIARLWCDVRM
jgi:predicted DNA-binding transcriptional regulator AlpA